jgi:DNA-binding NarL/FixJ family response regulator
VRGPQVLLVDDEPRLRGQLRQLLTDYGVDVIAEAGSGREAVELAGRLRPDVVLMDLRMPDMDGITATRLLVAALPSARVIILSAYEDPALRGGADQAGAFAYLVKGCPASQIADAIAQAGADRVDQQASFPATGELDG